VQDPRSVPETLLKKASRPRSENLEINSTCSVARRRRRSALIRKPHRASLPMPSGV
jgi:hypothetical protein